MEILANGTNSTAGEKVVYITGNLCKEVKFQFTLQAVDVMDATPNITHLVFNLSFFSSEYNQVQLHYGCEDDEQFYGFGSQYSQLGMKGKRLPLFLSEQGVGRGLQPITDVLDLFTPGAGKFLYIDVITIMVVIYMTYYVANKLLPHAGGSWYTTYTRVPFYITNYQRSLLLESLEYTVFDMTSKNQIVIELNAQTMEGRIIAGEIINKSDASSTNIFLNYRVFST